MSSYELALPFASPPLSLNDRMHWSRKSALTKQVRHAAHWVASSRRLPKGVDRVAVTLTYYPATNRNRDVDNLTATLKPCIDGLVDYGLVADDDSSHVTSQCRIGAVRRSGALTLTVEVLA